MFFNKKDKDPEKICRFCAYSALTDDEEFVICAKRGKIKYDYICRKYVYDLLKRDPGKQFSAPSLDYVDLDD